MSGASSAEEKQAPSAGNGGVGRNYTWGQTLSEVTMTIPVSKTVKTKTIELKIWRAEGASGDEQMLRFCADGEEMISGRLHARVKRELWQLDRDEGVVEVTLEKWTGNDWWPCVLSGEAVIDVQKVRPEDAKLDELDGETRQMVQKMMYDQRMKMMGQPTSDEQKKMEMLERFKKQHPEMDFSQAKIE